jgi:hypothetical protein
MVMHDRKVVERHLSKLQKLNYSQFRWWRNYQIPKPLPKNKLMIERIKNGDFETSPYFWCAQYVLWEKEDNDNDKSLEPYYQRKRGSMLLTKYEKLMLDFEKDEEERIETFINTFSKSLNVNKETLREEFESYQGTVLEFFKSKIK